jgi:tetratricopeptide (TPR) repeat protein
MKKDIKDLAYLITKSKEKGEPKPIVFLGAGASVSGGIPLASGIIKKILEEFKDKPAIKNLSKERKADYYELMSALNSKERKELFQSYISESKINVAHIYLAQLISEGYIDYVLTVNFDDLLLRACGLFNYTMPTYDISNSTDFTTTTPEKKSIIYLHGQHYGEWLLNSKGELDKVKDKISLLLNKICHHRTWIIVGYSGEDEVFDEINNFSDFNNDLYWVNYLDNDASEKVEKNLLRIPTKNAHAINGYDADTFFLDLNAKLGIATPEIFNKPFSFLQSMINQVEVPKADKIIENHKELYIGLSERIQISREWTEKAINEIQEIDSLEKFKQEIIDAYLKEDFENNVKKFLTKIKEEKFKKANLELSNFFLEWGVKLSNSINYELDLNLINYSIDKFEESIKIYPHNNSSYNNLGNAYLTLSKIKSDKNILIKAIENYNKSIEINNINNKSIAYNNLGNAKTYLYTFDKNIDTLMEANKYYKKSIELSAINSKAYYNYSSLLIKLYKINKDNKTLDKALENAKLGYEIDNISYNLACVYAIKGDKKNSLKYLTEAIQNKEISKEFVLKDEDWKNYLNDDEFLKISG